MSKNLFEESQQILLGLEEIYPDRPLISKVRFFIEKLNKKENNRDEILIDSFQILKDLGDFPVIDYLRKLLVPENPHQELLALISLIDHLTYNPLSKNLKIILKSMEISESELTQVQKQMISLLSDYEKEEGGLVFSQIKSLYLEKEKLVSVKKLTRLLDTIYNNTLFDRFRKMAEHFLGLGSDLQIFAFLYQAEKFEIFDRIKLVKMNFPESKIHLAMSRGHIKSTLWLVEKLKLLLEEKPYEIHICCGWYGLLATLIALKINKSFDLKTYDIDPSCQPISELLNTFWTDNQKKFKTITQDVYKLKHYGEDIKKAQCIINTSCEHLDSFQDWYSSLPDKSLIVLQNNNFFEIKEHVNCVHSLEEFKKMAPMSEIIFQGEMILTKYTRYMLIGYKKI